MLGFTRTEGIVHGSRDIPMVGSFFPVFALPQLLNTVSFACIMSH